jgi:hypothetical protein
MQKGTECRFPRFHIKNKYVHRGTSKPIAILPTQNNGLSAVRHRGAPQKGRIAGCSIACPRTSSFVPTTWTNSTPAPVRCDSSTSKDDVRNAPDTFDMHDRMSPTTKLHCIIFQSSANCKINITAHSIWVHFCFGYGSTCVRSFSLLAGTAVLNILLGVKTQNFVFRVGKEVNSGQVQECFRTLY